MSDQKNYDFDVCVIGAGVVGLACGRALSQSGHSVIVLDKESRIGEHTSSRNSEVIHAGLYYPTDSLKAQLCVRGNKMLYEFCRHYDVAHRRCGKYVVATSKDEIAVLEKLLEQAHINQVPEMSWVDSTPYDFIQCERALWSGSSGTVDVHGLMNALQAYIEQHNGVVSLDCEVKAIKQGFTIETAQGDIRTKIVINAAGLWAQELATHTEGMSADMIPPIQYARGHYMKPNVAVPKVEHLIYPVPAKDSLGTHITMDLAGQIRFGPDLEWIDEVDYSFGENREGAFKSSIQSYWPDFPIDSLVRDYTGVRPKIASRDFETQGEGVHGIKNLINLFGIDSPGLTSSLAIAEYVQATLDQS